MKIDRIHIEGFGVWSDKTWGPLGAGLNVFHGSNEAGKSTLMAFIRAVLFGFDRRGSPRRYEPVHGGVHGGSLDLIVRDRPVRIERRSSRHVRGAVTVQDGDSTGADAELDALLGGTTRTLYHNVFAFGLEELEQFHTLQENEVAQHLSGAALGIGAARWTAVQRELEARQSALFLPRGQTSVLNMALKELEAVRDDLERTEHQPEDYWAAHESKVRLAAEVAGLAEAVAELKHRAAHYEKRLKARPLWERRKTIEKQLEMLPLVETFPEGGVERLELLRNQFRALQAEYTQLRRDNDRRRVRRAELRASADLHELDRCSQKLEALRTLLPRVEAARRVYSSVVDRQKAIEQERNALQSAMDGLRPPSRASFIAFICLIWTAVAGLAWADLGYAAAVVAAASLIPVFWRRRRLRAFTRVQEQHRICTERQESCFWELRTIENDARRIEEDIVRLTGKSEISQADIDRQAAETGRLSKAVEDLRRLEDEMEHAQADLDRVSRQIEDRQLEIAALLREGGASTEREFRQRAETYKQREQLLNELRGIPFEPPETGFLFDVRENDEDAYNAIRGELSGMEQRLAEARHESGRVDERIAMMERSEERSRALARQELILSKIDAEAEQWAVVTLCRTLLDETRRVYETERQPEVLRQASFFFKLMTEGRYQRVIAPLDGSEIQVERADGTRLSPHLLSRGTAEQLYLAMRIALVRDYANHVGPLPVVFDDVFVNFDPGRTRLTIRAVRELAETHQVLLFTCHPHLVAAVSEIVPEAPVFSVQ